jgi:hypothetical protein
MDASPRKTDKINVMLFGGINQSWPERATRAGMQAGEQKSQRWFAVGRVEGFGGGVFDGH